MGIETGIWERGEGLGRKIGEEETGTTVERREGLGKRRDNKGGNTVKKEELDRRRERGLDEEIREKRGTGLERGEER